MNNYLNEQKDFLLNNIVKNLKNIHNKKEFKQEYFLVKKWNKTQKLINKNKLNNKLKDVV